MEATRAPGGDRPLPSGALGRRGLRGTDISLPARWVPIADVWDGITSHRPYRPAMALGEARRIMVAARGKIFDPDLFDIFMEEKGRLFQLYRTQ